MFKADFPLGKALVTKEGVLMRTYEASDITARSEQGMRQEKAQKAGLPFDEKPVTVNSHAWLMKFINHSPAMTIEAKDKHADQFNYFTENVSATDISSYQEIWYKNVYNKVDVRYYPSAEGSLEYDIVCKPGFDNSNIAIELEGITKMRVDGKGALIVTTSVGEMNLPMPVAYQKVNGKQVAVDAKYSITKTNTLKFELGAYNEKLPLIIDPIALRWATWVNSNSSSIDANTSGDNHGHGIWVDAVDGAIYIVARIDGQTNNITSGALEETPNGGVDLIVGKYLEPDTIGGTGTRVWQTYIGGSADDNPYAMEMGPDRNLYITGYTASSNFPLIGGAEFGATGGLDQRTQTTDNTFILKINRTGNAIKSAVIGGDGDDGSFDLRTTSSGDIIICGNTKSKNLATLFSGSGATNRASNYAGGTDVHLFKINQSLSSIIWMKNYGGAGTDQATIMVQNSANGDIYLGGHTTSTDFPTKNPRQNTRGGDQSGFLQKLNTNGNVVWSSYYRSASSKKATILCMEFNTLKNRLYFGGITTGLEAPSNMPASGNYDRSQNGSNDFYVASMDTNQTFVNSTYIGGANNEVNMMGLNVDLNNDVYVFGYSNSVNFPVTADALQPLLNNTASNPSSPVNDKVFFKLPGTLAAAPLYSTYYGGSSDDYDPVGERGIKFSNCRVYTIVTGKSNDLPLTKGAITTSKGSSTSIYEPGLVVWANPPDLLNNTISGSQTICAGAPLSGLSGSVPSYSLAKISRNGSHTNYPAALSSAATYTWQSSIDSTNWSTINGANLKDLSPSLIDPMYQKTYFRRIIGGDACIIAGAANQSVKVTVLSVPGEISHVSCFGLNDGSVTANPDGTSPYQYSWIKVGNAQVISTNKTISGLQPGAYQVTVTDGSNCTATETFQVNQPSAALSATTSSTNSTCGSSNGTATVSASGGTLPYTYLWSNGSMITNPTGLSAGFYTVTVKDANQCSFATDRIVNNTSLLSITIISKTNVTCNGGASGAVSAAGGNGTSPYTYSFNGGGYQSSGTFSGVAQGTYPISVKDGSNCISTTTVTISEPGVALSASLSDQTNVVCAGQTNGTATVVASGGTPPYSYVWSPTGGTGATGTGLTNGAYTVQIKDANQCSIDPISVTISTSDNSKPVWSTLEDALNATIECNNTSALEAAQTAEPIATDNGTISYTKTSGDFVLGICPSTGTFTNTWVAKDPCGNSSDVFTQIITITDLIAPIWSTVAGSLNTSVSCSNPAELQAAQALVPLAEDNCSSVSITKSPGEFVAGSCGSSGSYTNTWIAKDSCNNTSKEFTQIISVIDDSKPIITTCAETRSISANAKCKAEVPDFTAAIVANDNCTASNNLVITQNPVAGTRVDLGATTISILVKDACGNEATCNVTLHVTSLIDAINDAGTTVNGFAGGTSVENVLANDTLNCSILNPSDVILSFISSTNSGVSLKDSSVVVAPGTPAGDYTLIYRICEATNPDNCDNAEVTVTVNSTTIEANDDNGNTVNGYAGGTSFTNVLENDKLNELPVNTAEVTLSFVSSTNSGVSLSGSDVIVAPGTPEGSYTLTYKICEVLNPSNCDEAEVSVPVTKASIVANDDAGIAINGYIGGTTFTNVLSNDELNGLTVVPEQIALTFVSSTNSGVTLVGKDVRVASNTPAGDYSLIYRICEVLNPSNCDEAEVTVKVTSPTIVANDDDGSAVNGVAGGISFTNVLSNDQLNGVDVNPSEVTLSFVGSTNSGVTLSGKNVVVAPGTPSGNYTLTYSICEILNPSNCDDAEVSVPVSVEPPIARKGEFDNCFGTKQAAEAAAIAATQVIPGNCAGEVSKTASTDGTCDAVITVTLSDNCGNSDTVVYHTRIDNNAPTWLTDQTALNRVVSCENEAGLIEAKSLEPTATDNCGLPLNYTKTRGSFVAGECGSTGTYENTWVAKDACGNESSVFTQVISIIDNTAPTWTSEEESLNRSVSCDDQNGLTAAQALTPEATDNCGGVVRYVKTSGTFRVNSCGGNYTNRWVAKDGCDNISGYFTQVIRITDNTAPTWTTTSAALNRDIPCENTLALLAAQLISPVATDNCDSTVTYTKTSGAFVPGACGNSGTYINTWIAKDVCNNESEVFTQVITVKDLTPPVISQAGASVTISCPESPVFTPPTATDACSGTATIVLVSDVTTPGSTPGSYIQTKTWKAVDGCENSSENRSQTITYLDNPTISTTRASICQGQSYLFNDINYNIGGEYSIQTVNTQGCNLTKKLVLSIYPPSIPATSINASASVVPSGTAIALTVVGGSLGNDASWKWYVGGCGIGTAIGTGSSIIVTPTAATTYFVRAEGSCGNSACTSKTIGIESSGGCSAYEVVSFTQGKRKNFTNVLAARSNPERALNTPQHNDASNSPINFVALGFGGELVLKFRNPIANGPGNDLRVAETSFGNPQCNSFRERVRVSVSQNGSSYQVIGEGCLNSDFNLDVANLPWAQYVKLVDISNRADFPNDADGYDVDGIECLNGEAQLGCHAKVASNIKQGKTKAGNPVLPIRSNTEKALGQPEPTATGVVNFYALGFGGEMTLEFDGAIANGPGADVKIHETTFGNGCATYPEKADIFASQNGNDFTYLGRACQTESFDLGLLSWARFIRIVDVSEKASFPMDADGFDVNGIECLNGSAISQSDDGLVSCSAQKVIHYSPKMRKNSTDILAERKNPSKALGAPQNDNTNNFVSLGFGGKLVVKFDYTVFNRPGNDVKVFETTFGNYNCGNYPERARISASIDNLTWVTLGEICMDGELDLGAMPYAQYFCVYDISDASNIGFDGLADGYDLDAIVAIQQPCVTPNNRRISEEEDVRIMPGTPITVEIFPNPITESTVIQFHGLESRSTFNLDLFDASGRLIRREQMIVEASSSTYTLKIGDLPKGVLIALISGNEKRFVHRLIH